MKKIIAFSLLFLAIAKPATAFEVLALCEDKDGNTDIYAFEYTNETNEQIEQEIFDYCSNIGRLFVGYPEK